MTNRPATFDLRLSTCDMRPATASIPRRYFLHACAIGLGKLAAASLLSASLPSSASSAPPREKSAAPLAPRPPHIAPKAKAVIHLFMAGAPSQLDLFDYKPKLVEYEGKPIPPEVIG